MVTGNPVNSDRTVSNGLAVSTVGGPPGAATVDVSVETGGILTKMKKALGAVKLQLRTIWQSGSPDASFSPLSFVLRMSFVN